MTVARAICRGLRWSMSSPHRPMAGWECYCPTRSQTRWSMSPPPPPEGWLEMLWPDEKSDAPKPEEAPCLFGWDVDGAAAKFCQYVRRRSIVDAAQAHCPWETALCPKIRWGLWSWSHRWNGGDHRADSPTPCMHATTLHTVGHTRVATGKSRSSGCCVTQHVVAHPPSMGVRSSFSRVSKGASRSGQVSAMLERWLNPLRWIQNELRMHLLQWQRVTLLWRMHLPQSIVA
jgi:hypothetical protein